MFNSTRYRSVLFGLMILTLTTYSSGCVNPDDDCADDDTGPVDADGDTWSEDEDCDDHDPNNYPGNDELCDGQDNNCNDFVDEEAVDCTMWYVDLDEDGFGSEEYGDALCQCSEPDGSYEYSLNDSDCDDSLAHINPDATEDCTSYYDIDCSGSPYDGHNDMDGDGFIDTACADSDGTDCDDNDPTIYPGAEETVVNDGIDNNCDGVDFHYTKVVMGGFYGCAKFGDTLDHGHVCWGDTESENLYPFPIEPLTAVAAGFYHMCAIVENGDWINCWGDPSYNMTTPPTSNNGFQEISAAGYHTCALELVTNEIFCWGRDDSGQSESPEGTFKSVEVGPGSSCGITTTDSLLCWGDVEVNDPDSYDQVAVGNGHV